MTSKHNLNTPSRNPNRPKPKQSPLNDECMPEQSLSSMDHRILGQRLDMFSIHEDVGAGLVLWHPHGTTVRRIIRDFWEQEHLKHGYQLVSTPHIAKGGLWDVSGHTQYYREHMYMFQMNGESYVVKPMNCPFHIYIYHSKPRSYRDLPLRYAEWGTVYRYERSGTLHGLLRVRGLTQDDAHIFCTPKQINDEIRGVLQFSDAMLRTFGFSDITIELSTRDPHRPEKYMGSNDEWHAAESALRQTLEREEYPFIEAPGEAAFYGPKIDIHIVDATGRDWQCATIQFDFNLPRRFNVTYIEADGKPHRVVMVHRVLLGAIERFYGILLEHYQGYLPLWLAPIQVRVLPISHHALQYAMTIERMLTARGIRSDLDASSSTLNYKIRAAELQKIPYLAICGRIEASSHTISLRKHGGHDLGRFCLQEAVTRILNAQN